MSDSLCFWLSLCYNFCAVMLWSHCVFSYLSRRPVALAEVKRSAMNVTRCNFSCKLQRNSGVDACYCVQTILKETPRYYNYVRLTFPLYNMLKLVK